MAQKAVAPKNRSAVWEAVSRWLPVANPDQQYWWKLTGSHVSQMMVAAGYSVEAQYNALLFHYSYILPYLGTAPKHDGKLQWNSLLGNKGSPIEYSWKWNTTKAKPDVRYCIEAIGPYAGRPLDPLNQDASMEMLHRIADAVPTVDLTLNNHFMNALYSHDRSKHAADNLNGATSSILIAPEWLEKGFSIKSYYLPGRFGSSTNTSSLLTLPEWEAPIAKFDPDNEARKAMFDFLANNPEGQALIPYMLAVDNVEPSKSRLKLYFLGSHTSFAAVRTVMTMGGHKKVPEEYLQDLRALICAVVGVGPDFPETEELPPPSAFTTWTQDNSGEVSEVMRSCVYYFDIAPGKLVPDIKFYIPVRDYGPKDGEIARSMMDWMSKHGRGAYNDAYLNMLKYLNKYRNLDESKGAHSYISCLIKDDGEFDITSYLGAEAVLTGMNGHA